MTRETVKTIAGLIIIAAIVVATFMYGNHQRQAQLAHDQDVKKQQEAKVAAASTATPTVSVSPTPSASASANTAPVNTPSSNAIQGSAKTGGSATPVPATPAPAPTAVPDTGGTAAAAPLAETGPPLGGFIGIAAIIGMIIAVRRSSRAMLDAARGKR